jgi:hypothetical protein
LLLANIASPVGACVGKKNPKASAEFSSGRKLICREARMWGSGLIAIGLRIEPMSYSYRNPAV